MHQKFGDASRHCAKGKEIGNCMRLTGRPDSLLSRLKSIRVYAGGRILSDVEQAFSCQRLQNDVHQASKPFSYAFDLSVNRYNHKLDFLCDFSAYLPADGHVTCLRMHVRPNIQRLVCPDFDVADLSCSSFSHEQQPFSPLLTWRLSTTVCTASGSPPGVAVKANRRKLGFFRIM